VLVQAMMEVRRRNLIIFIVIPSLILLENYIVVHRSNAIFFVYKRTDNGNNYRGWKAYSRSKTAEIYHKAKKNYGIIPRVFTSLRGKFHARQFEINGVKMHLPYETFPEIEYDNKKGIAFGDKKAEEAQDENLMALRELKYKIAMIQAPGKKKITKKYIAECLGVTESAVRKWKYFGDDLKTDPESGE